MSLLKIYTKLRRFQKLLCNVLFRTFLIFNSSCFFYFKYNLNLPHADVGQQNVSAAFFPVHIVIGDEGSLVIGDEGD